MLILEECAGAFSKPESFLGWIRRGKKQIENNWYNLSSIRHVKCARWCCPTSAVTALTRGSTLTSLHTAARSAEPSAALPISRLMSRRTACITPAKSDSGLCSSRGSIKMETGNGKLGFSSLEICLPYSRNERGCSPSLVWFSGWQNTFEMGNH